MEEWYISKDGILVKSDTKLSKISMLRSGVIGQIYIALVDGTEHTLYLHKFKADYEEFDPKCKISRLLFLNWVEKTFPDMTTIKTPLKPGSKCHTDKNTLDRTENNLSTQKQIEESELETNEDPEEVVEDIKDMNETENIEDVFFVEFTNDKIFLAVLADNEITYTKRPYAVHIYGTPSISKTINYSLESEKYDYNYKYIVGKIPSSLLKKSKGGVVIVNLQKVQKSFEEHSNAYLKNKN